VLSHFFVNDLFGLQIKTVQLNMCADDGHLLNLRYGSDIFGRAYLTWAGIDNRRTLQDMILGNTEHQFNFLANDSLHLFGVTVDKDFTCKKV